MILFGRFSFDSDPSHSGAFIPSLDGLAHCAFCASFRAGVSISGASRRRAFTPSGGPVRLAGDPPQGWAFLVEPELRCLSAPLRRKFAGGKWTLQHEVPKIGFYVNIVD